MTTSKHCRGFLAITIALAMIFSTMFIPGGKAARAADGEPSVKVLGATLRLNSSKGDNVNGKQSMRIGIQIDNASFAKDCAIEVAIGSKTYVVSTRSAAKLGIDSTNYINNASLFSKDSANNSVVYAAVVVNIPRTGFSTNISITGKVWRQSDDRLYTSDTVNKNVYGVVNSMAARYPSLNICIDDNGRLCKSAGSAELTAADLAGYPEGPDASDTSDQQASSAPTAVPTATPVPTPTPTPLPKDGTYAVKVPAGSTITVDGTVDKAWDNAIEYPFTYYSAGRARNSSSATIKLMWDENNMYGLFDVYDARIDSSNANGWEKDGVEIFFDEDNSKEAAYGEANNNANTDAFQYRCAGLSSPSPARPVANGFSKATDATQSRYSKLTSNVKAASNGCGYRVEFAIPLYRKASVGRVVGFDATVMDAEGGVRNNEIWFTGKKPVGENVGLYHNASLFADVMFINVPDPIPETTPAPDDPEGCLAHFTFDLNTLDGYTYSSTDGNAKATVMGNITSGTDSVSGRSIYMADNSASYLNVKNVDGSSLLDGKDNVTISYWSKVTRGYTNGSMDYGWAFYAGRHGTSLGALNRYYLAMADRSDKYCLEMAKTGGRGNKADDMGKGIGAWNNVTVVVKDNGDGTSTSSVYVNGVLSKTLNGMKLSTALGTNSDFFIGMRPWAAGTGADYFKGYIDDFAVFDRAFTAAEVSEYTSSFGKELPTSISTPRPANASIQAHYTDTAITIDGASDDAWASVEAIPFNYYSVSKSSTNAAVKLMWDDTYMYALIDVTDPLIVRSATDPWERDGVEVFFDEDASGEAAYEDNYDAFQYRYTGYTTTGAAATFDEFASASAGAMSIYAGKKIVYKPTSRGYAVECAIPFYFSPEEGQVVGFDISVMDCGTSGRNNEIWFTGPAKDQMYQDASLMGRVKLAPAVTLNTVPAGGRPDVNNIDSCIAYFTFDEINGGIYTAESGSAKATVSGNRLNLTSDSVAGNSVYMPENNNSYLFISNNDGTSLLGGRDKFTISYWSNVPDETNDVGWVFFAKDSSQTAADRYTIALREQFDNIRFQRAKVEDGETTAASEYLYASHPQSVPGTWKNVTVVIDDGNTDLYVNGKLTSNQAAISPNLSTYIKDSSQLYIGYAPTGSGEYYYGYVDELAVMNKAYSADEVAAYVDSYNYKAPLPTPTPNVQIMSCSDYQIWYWSNEDHSVHDDRESLIPQVRQIFEGVKYAGFDKPDFFLFGGDLTSTHNVDSQDEGMAQLKELVYGTWDCLSDENSLYIQGNHDESEPGTHGIASSGAHIYDEFIIYALNDDIYPSTQDKDDSKELIQNTAADLASFLSDLADAGERRPIFIASHAGLHYDIDRTDGNNQYAYIIYDVLQEHADDLDIIFLFGHNHSNGDEIVGGSITCLERGSTIEVTHENSIANKKGTPSVIGFTYMNYGYIGNVGNIYNNTYNYAPWLTNLLVVNSINIFDDRITVDRYSANRKEREYHSEFARLHN